MATNVTAIAAGEYQSLFLKSDGSLWAMGQNASGQYLPLGDPTGQDYVQFFMLTRQHDVVGTDLPLLLQNVRA